MNPVATWRRWVRSRRIARGFVEFVEVDVPGVGVRNIAPMSTQMYFAAGSLSSGDFAERLALCAWVSCECVKEYLDMKPSRLTAKLSPVQLVNLGAAVLEVSGLTETGQEKIEKKSEEVPESGFSGTS